MQRAEARPGASDLIAELEGKYMWWRPVGAASHSAERVIAQVMNLGTYEDIRRLERVLGAAVLAGIARNAVPGWFTPRSWEFWRGRLAASGYSVDPSPPRRTFDADGH